MNINTIAENANVICRIIREKQEIKAGELLKESKLFDSDFYIAIGWLAREGRISFREIAGINRKTVEVIDTNDHQ